MEVDIKQHFQQQQIAEALKRQHWKKQNVGL